MKLDISSGGGVAVVVGAFKVARNRARVFSRERAGEELCAPDVFQNQVGFFYYQCYGFSFFWGSRIIHLGKIRGFTPKIPKTRDLSPPRYLYFRRKKLLSALEHAFPYEVGGFTCNEKCFRYGIIGIHFYMFRKYCKYCHFPKVQQMYAQISSPQSCF